MAKVTITIEDTDIENGAVGVNFEFTPEFPQEVEGDENPPQLTPAQTMAVYINRVISAASAPEADEEASDDAGCAQTNEGTCCGGNCTPAPAEG
jgi:hypothetical protein